MLRCQVTWGINLHNYSVTLIRILKQTTQQEGTTQYAVSGKSMTICIYSESYQLQINGMYSVAIDIMYTVKYEDP